MVAELGGDFERFTAEVGHDLRTMTSWIMNEVRGPYGGSLGQYRHFEALLDWKEDFFALFIPSLDEMAQDILELQNWADTIEADGGSEADTGNNK